MNSGSVAEKSRWDHASIIKDKKLVAAEQFGKLGKIMVFDDTGVSEKCEQPGRVAPGQRSLRNPFSREDVVEFVEAHGIEPV
jgi:hypothetical protein